MFSGQVFVSRPRNLEQQIQQITRLRCTIKIFENSIQSFSRLDWTWTRCRDAYEIVRRCSDKQHLHKRCMLTMSIKRTVTCFATLGQFRSSRSVWRAMHVVHILFIRFNLIEFLSSHIAVASLALSCRPTWSTNTISSTIYYKFS